MLSASQAAVINNKIALQLKSVGGTECPPSKNNTESAAWAYYVAHKIEAFGKAAKAAAVKDGIKQGVIFDHLENPLEPGTEKDVYNGDVIRISVTVKNPSVTIDGKAFYDSLTQFLSILDKADNVLRPGDLKGAIDDMYMAVQKTSRPAHTFTATLLSD